MVMVAFNNRPGQRLMYYVHVVHIDIGVELGVGSILHAESQVDRIARVTGHGDSSFLSTKIVKGAVGKWQVLSCVGKGQGAVEPHLELVIGGIIVVSILCVDMVGERDHCLLSGPVGQDEIL